MNFLGTKSS